MMPATAWIGGSGDGGSQGLTPSALSAAGSLQFPVCEKQIRFEIDQDVVQGCIQFWILWPDMGQSSPIPEVGLLELPGSRPSWTVPPLLCLCWLDPDLQLTLGVGAMHL